MRLVAKIGTSSITDALGVIDNQVVDGLCDQLAALRAGGHEVILVSSGAVSAGVAALGMSARPTDTPTLQAISAAGQKHQYVACVLRRCVERHAHHRSIRPFAIAPGTVTRLDGKCSSLALQ